MVTVLMRVNSRQRTVNFMSEADQEGTDIIYRMLALPVCVCVCVCRRCDQSDRINIDIACDQRSRREVKEKRLGRALRA